MNLSFYSPIFLSVYFEEEISGFADKLEKIKKTIKIFVR